MLPNPPANRWMMIIEFDSVEKQIERDPEYAYPDDEVSRVIRKIADWSGVLSEELGEICTFDKTTIKMSFSYFQNVADLIEFIEMNTVPKRLEIKRCEDL